MKLDGTLVVYVNQKPNEEPRVMTFQSRDGNDFDQQYYGRCLTPDGIEVQVSVEYEPLDLDALTKRTKDTVARIRAKAEEEIAAVMEYHNKWLALPAPKEDE